jgi:hypothetical protein
MGQDITEREALLIELVHMLSYGSESELGLTLPEVMKFLDARVARKGMKTSLELLEEERHSFIEEVRQYMADSKTSVKSAPRR